MLLEGKELYDARQAEIDAAPTREEADDWFRHVNVLEAARQAREPGYVPHVYRRKGGPPIRRIE